MGKKRVNKKNIFYVACVIKTHDLSMQRSEIDMLVSTH